MRAASKLLKLIYRQRKRVPIDLQFQDALTAKLMVNLQKAKDIIQTNLKLNKIFKKV